MRDHRFMDDPEGWLRQIAKLQSDYIENSPEKYRPAALHSAWGICRGAVLALGAAGVLDSVKGFGLVDEILTPATQATRSDGPVERVTASVHSVHSATGVPERQFLLDSVAVMTRRAVLTDDEATAIKRRIDEQFPSDDLTS